MFSLVDVSQYETLLTTLQCSVTMDVVLQGTDTFLKDTCP